MSTEALSLEFAIPEEVKMKAAQQRAIRKLNWALLPLMCLMVATCYIDRSNLAFASLQLKQDPPFEFTDTTYGLGSGIFFIGYAMFQVPSNVVLARVGAPVWLGIIVSLWGLAACLLAGMNSLAAFLILRFLLGVAEAGTFPGMWYHLSLFYPNRHLTVPISATNVAIAVAQIIASPLAAVLLSMDGVAGLRGWQWLFLLEGMPTVLLGMAIFLFLPRTPYDIKGMTASERELITSGVEAGAKPGKALQGGVGEMWRDIKAAASNRMLWYMAVAFALKSATSKGLMFWTPLAIEAITGLDSSQSSNTKVVLLASIPYLASTVFQIWQAWSSQRTQERRLHTGLPFVVGGLLMAMVPLLWQAAPSGVFLVLVVAQGVVHAVGPWTAMVSGLFSSESQAAGLAIWNSVGNIGGFFGSALYGILKDRLGSDAAGMLLLGCTLLAAGAMVLAAKDPGAAPPQYQRLPAHADDVPPAGGKAART